MNAPKLNPLKRDWVHERSQPITVRNLLQTSAAVVVCGSKNSRSRFIPLVFSVCSVTVDKRCILQQHCIKGQIQTCLLETRWYNFEPCIPPLTATVHSVTDRQTDGQTDDMMMPIADQTVYQYDGLKTNNISIDRDKQRLVTARCMADLLA